MRICLSAIFCYRCCFQVMLCWSAGLKLKISFFELVVFKFLLCPRHINESITFDYTVRQRHVQAIWVKHLIRFYFFFCMSVDCTSICLTCITFSKLFIQSNQLSCCRWFIPSVWWLFIILWKQVHSKYCTWNLISHPEVFVKYNAVITYGYATHWPLFGNHGFK